MNILPRVIAWFVIAPSIAVAAFLTMMSFGVIIDGFRSGQGVGLSLGLIVALMGGWFGLSTLCDVHQNFVKCRWNFNRERAWWGLLSGSLVSILLIASSAGSLAFRVMFFGWPLLAVAYYALAIWRSPDLRTQVTDTERLPDNV
jgi:hypothetical protein